MKVLDSATQAYNKAIAKIMGKPLTFTVCVGICVHREIKVKVFNKLRLLDRCPNPKFEFRICEGDALIDRSRGRVATSFVNSQKSDYLLFLDDDVLYDPKDIQKMCLTMQHNDLDILCGAYTIKDEKNPVFAIRTLTNDETLNFGVNGAVSEIMYGSTGCMLIHRRVFQKMIDVGMVHLCHPQTMAFYPFFMPMEKNLNGKWLYLSEDWAFCERARNLGFKVWVDTTTKLTHLGEYGYGWKDLVGTPKKDVDNIVYHIDVQKE